MDNNKPELSRLLSIEGIIPDKTREEIITATADECAELAARLDLRELESLTAKLSIRRVSGGSILRVAGHISADVVQGCVVSLQDVPATIEADFETFFTQAPDSESHAKELSFTAEDEDSPEMIVNGMIDLGEVVTQYLSLNLETYPRAPGVSLAAQLAEAGIKGRENPFAVLESLKKDGKSKK
jgi:uncharacterized metal-binding protein YceD (DUF177 family)